ncbi:P-loop containing nucleoside triphosphate hydrolase protein [Mycena rosella]|uniref:P-loop containing nucleoside triphosphate hydrolase protein n=1 Tax=Mycena rosella TaxID=1033263 RepID=A0AAD7DAL2_MYCRO|nr:P-loop containing nucleoside triphosphate hydrolase protein [Mycena rosella]
MSIFVICNLENPQYMSSYFKVVHGLRTVGRHRQTASYGYMTEHGRLLGQPSERGLYGGPGKRVLDGQGRESQRGSDTSICASSGSPPGSNLAADDIQDWVHEVADDRNADGTLVSDYTCNIKIVSYTLALGDQLLIDDATIMLERGRKYGLLGENGSGKSTFLQSPAAHDIKMPGFEIQLVSDGVEPSNITPLQFLVDAAHKEMEFATLMPKASSILEGLGFTSTVMCTPTMNMSDGWRVRVNLGHALFVKPHMLLLDEPTKHLDPGAVVWLKTQLKMYDGILVIASHSHDFMGSLTTGIVHLTNKKLAYPPYKYSKWMDGQQYRIKHLQRAIGRARDSGDVEEKLRLSRMLTASIVVCEPIRFNFGGARELEEGEWLTPLVKFDQVAFSDINGCIYHDLSFSIGVRARIAILGDPRENSTLFDLLIGALLPSAGTISKNAGLNLVRYSHQSAQKLPEDVSPLQYFQQRLDMGFQESQSQLQRFGLSVVQQRTRIRHLSDGLQNRVAFAQLAMQHPHILILDEPTNHMDVEFVEALVHAIKEFGGGVIIVSNNFRLISQVTNELWEVTGGKINGGIRIQHYRLQE